MSTDHDPSVDPSRPQAYQIRLRGHLGRRWEASFEGWSIRLEDDGDTVLSGPVADQAALHGLLKRVRDLGMPVVSVVQIEPEPAPHSDPRSTT